MSTDKIENKDNAEQKISKDELSEKELEKTTGGFQSGEHTTTTTNSVGIGLRKSGGDPGPVGLPFLD